MRQAEGPTRARNAVATRSAILSAARSRFAEEGYDAASVRGIAGEAGVDPALVLRYFGSKEELLAAVLAESGSVRDLLEGPREDFGARAARMLLLDPVEDHKLAVLQIILRSASSARAGPLVRRNTQERFYEPIEAWLGGPDAQIRARAVGAIIMGAALSRAIDNNGLEDEADRLGLAGRLAETLQLAIE
ncbi:TetR/AcrR family transcriptional regulator [Phenylobacterium sp. J367]|uniref:TetR/AcrR family transcriptional regulator n=1 Tax=Phenylobacterium sp. J367 TaxID=2898435 RepID=UPI0021508970|nr:TetR/AcrR family transcriptional regulator [Phenylobacterium sp. J367]